MNAPKLNVLTAGVMTAVAAAIGGIEPAWAGTIVQSQSFSVSAADQDSDTLFYPSFPATADFNALGNTSSRSFSLFNTLGGTLALTNVIVRITSGQDTSMRVDVSGSCFTDVSGISTNCDANATNHSEFSALIDLGGGIDVGSLQFFDTPAGASCSTGLQDYDCGYSDSQSPSPLVVDPFLVTISDPAQLALFAGPGTFDVVSQLDLTGNYGASISVGTGPVGGIVPANGGTRSNTWGVSANTAWNGDIQVTYDYREVPQGVPEPATSS
jgi:hypothetical protein